MEENKNVKTSRQDEDQIKKGATLSRIKSFFGDMFSRRDKGGIAPRRKGKMAGRHRRLLFYIALIALPVLQFCVFYIYVNINSILLAFREYDAFSGYKWVWFKNFEKVIDDVVNSNILHDALKNSFIAFAIGLVIGTTMPMIVSYYIYKKRLFAKFFRIMLFMPSIISSLALVLAYKFFVEVSVPELYSKLVTKMPFVARWFGETEIQGLLSNIKTQAVTVFFYTFWFGMGSSFLLYTSTMAGIPDGVVEAAKIDGVSPMKEFFCITVPMIWPTYVTFVVISIGALFVNQINLFSLYGIYAPTNLYTIGYYLYMKTSLADLGGYPYLAAFGLLCTAINVPLCLGVRKLMEKFGPKTE